MTDNDLTAGGSEGFRPSPRGSLREEIARILHDANTGKIVPDDSDPTKYGAMADALIDAGFGTDGGVKLASMLNEWVGGEPYEISQARTRSEEFPLPEGQSEGFLNGYAAAVSHVEAILEESAVVPERWEYDWSPHPNSWDKEPTREAAEKAYYMAVGAPIYQWKRRVPGPNPWIRADG